MLPEEFDISHKEQNRLREMLKIIPKGYSDYLDVGTQHGYLPLCLVDHFENLTAVDIVKPDINHPRIKAITGDIRELSFADDAFDVVSCTEVLEHIPSPDLATACTELARVTRQYLVIGVPYKQDLRVGRSLCTNCGKVNPPWGHVNSFDESRLKTLFDKFKVVDIAYHGKEKEFTNIVSALLIGLAGYPYGTKGSNGHCIFCDAVINEPAKTLLSSVFTKASVILDDIYKSFLKEKWIWMHVIFKKIPA